MSSVQLSFKRHLTAPVVNPLVPAAGAMTKEGQGRMAYTGQ